MRELHEVLLASASPRRREILTSLGLRVTVLPSEIDEGDRPGYGPRGLAALHAGAKAEACFARQRQQLIVAADTVVDLDGIMYGKPAGAVEARWMLSRLSARDHMVHTAVSLIDGPTGQRLQGVASTRVRFAPLDEAEIDAYVATGEPLDKAGAYGIQGRGAALVESIDGDFYTVMGFPLGMFVRELLPQLGYRLQTGTPA